jgi:hypothetical protein
MTPHAKIRCEMGRVGNSWQLHVVETSRKAGAGRAGRLPVIMNPADELPRGRRLVRGNQPDADECRATGARRREDETNPPPSGDADEHQQEQAAW